MTKPTDDKATEAAETADAELTELVAYLDGELDDQAADRLERRLVRDSGLRQRAELLDRTWHLLDSLEELTASGEFTQRTLASMSVDVPESAAGAASAAASLRSRTRPSLPVLAVCCAGCFLCTTIGLVAGQWAAVRNRDPGEVEMLQNLDLLQHYFNYRPIPDEAFLRQLQHSLEQSPAMVGGQEPRP